MVQDIRSLTDVYNAILAGGGGGSTADIIAQLDLLLSATNADPANTNLRSIVGVIKNILDQDTDFYTGGVNDSVLYDVPSSRRAIDALIEIVNTSVDMENNLTTIAATIVEMNTYVKAIESPTTFSLNRSITFAASNSEVIPASFTCVKLLQVVATNNTDRIMVLSDTTSGCVMIVPNLSSVDITCMFGLSPNFVTVVTQNGTNANGEFYLNFYYTYYP